MPPSGPSGVPPTTKGEHDGDASSSTSWRRRVQRPPYRLRRPRPSSWGLPVDDSALPIADGRPAAAALPRRRSIARRTLLGGGEGAGGEEQGGIIDDISSSSPTAHQSASSSSLSSSSWRARIDEINIILERRQLEGVPQPRGADTCAPRRDPRRRGGGEEENDDDYSSGSEDLEEEEEDYDDDDDDAEAAEEEEERREEGQQGVGNDDDDDEDTIVASGNRLRQRREARRGSLAQGARQQLVRTTTTSTPIATRSGFLRASRRLPYYYRLPPITDDERSDVHYDLFGKRPPDEERTEAKLVSLEIECEKQHQHPPEDPGAAIVSTTALMKALRTYHLLFVNAPHAKMLPEQQQQEWPVPLPPHLRLNHSGVRGEDAEEERQQEQQQQQRHAAAAAIRHEAAALRMARYWDVRRTYLGTSACYAPGVLPVPTLSDYVRHYRRTLTLLTDPRADPLTLRAASDMLRVVDSRKIEAMDVVLDEIEEESYVEYNPEEHDDDMAAEACLRAHARAMATESDDEWKLMFLRREDMIEARAARALVRYCEVGMRLFGPNMLIKRTIGYEDLRDECGALLRVAAAYGGGGGPGRGGGQRCRSGGGNGNGGGLLPKLMNEEDEFGRSILVFSRELVGAAVVAPPAPTQRGREHDDEGDDDDGVLPMEEQLDRLGINEIHFAKVTWYLVHLALERESCRRNGLVLVFDGRTCSGGNGSGGEVTSNGRAASKDSDSAATATAATGDSRASASDGDRGRRRNGGGKLRRRRGRRRAIMDVLRCVPAKIRTIHCLYDDHHTPPPPPPPATATPNNGRRRQRQRQRWQQNRQRQQCRPRPPLTAMQARDLRWFAETVGAKLRRRIVVHSGAGPGGGGGAGGGTTSATADDRNDNTTDEQEESSSGGGSGGSNLFWIRMAFYGLTREKLPSDLGGTGAETEYVTG